MVKKERTCKKCGCTEERACRTKDGPCYWVADDLCSECLVHEDEVGSWAPAADGDKIHIVKLLKENKAKNMQRISIPTTELLAMLEKVKEVTVAKPMNEILTNVYIKVLKKGLQLIATDLNVTLIANIDFVNDGEFGYEYLLPFDFLFKICKAVDSEFITVEYNESIIKPKGENITTRSVIITTLSDTFDIDKLDDPVMWPALPAFDIKNSVGIGEDFINCLNHALMTTSNENTRAALQKVFLKITPDGLTMASTNTKVVYEKKFDFETTESANLLVNAKICKALDGFKNTSISWNNTHLAFVSSNITLIGTLQDEQFPDYTRYFPASEKNLHISLSELRSLMNKILINKTPLNSPKATLWLKREIGLIVVDTYNPDLNRSTTIRVACDYSGNCERITIDPADMLKLLSQVSYMTLSVTITEQFKAILIETDADDSYRSIIMPLYTA